MIFEPISKITDKRKIAFFKELVELYVKIIAVIAKKDLDNFKAEHKSDINKYIIQELIKIGIIETELDIPILKSILGLITFNKFINSVEYKIKNNKLIKNQLDNLNNSYRLKQQQKFAKNKMPKIIDFFCGAGGLSLGFKKEGFKTILANDYESVCVQTYRYNHPEIPANKIIEGDIRLIVDKIQNFITEEVDIVVGGPPCQGFSSANQQRIIDDPRNELYKYFIKSIEKTLPKFVVMENVRGMLPYANQVVDDYKKIKIKKGGIFFEYDVSFKLLNSNNFGVAQSRQRLIYIAIRRDHAIKKKITPEILFEEIEKNSKKCEKPVLKEALEYIKPLTAPRIKHMNELDDEKTGKKVDLNSYIGNENRYIKAINESRIIPIIFNHKARYANDINYEIYKRLGQGEDATSKKIADIMPYSHRNHLFKDKYFKLIEDKPSRTITAHLRMDCHSHIHPQQVRSITPREAARIQSFPDDYLFLGPYLKTYMQIGNAVPPLMANAIAKVIKKYI